MRAHTRKLFLVIQADPDKREFRLPCIIAHIAPFWDAGSVPFLGKHQEQESLNKLANGLLAIGE
jgi:hypothetical protein